MLSHYKNGVAVIYSLFHCNYSPIFKRSIFKLLKSFLEGKNKSISLSPDIALLFQRFTCFTCSCTEPVCRQNSCTGCTQPAHFSSAAQFLPLILPLPGTLQALPHSHQAVPPIAGRKQLLSQINQGILSYFPVPADGTAPTNLRVQLQVLHKLFKVLLLGMFLLFLGVFFGRPVFSAAEIPFLRPSGGKKQGWGRKM